MFHTDNWKDRHEWHNLIDIAKCLHSIPTHSGHGDYISQIFDFLKNIKDYILIQYIYW